MTIKKILKFIFILFTWFVSSLLIRYDSSYYNSLSIPSIALPPSIISISWVILFILITISIYIVTSKTNILKNKDYLYILITNYIACQSFTLAFFKLRSPFFAFVLTVIIFITSIYLYIETKKIDKKASYLLVPYTLYSLYALILSIVVFTTNF
ncbi:MAG: TspO/MBR family protein [Bacilli bacterium]